MQLPVALLVHECKALGAHELLALLAEQSRLNLVTLVAQWLYTNLRCRMIATVAIEVTFPEARHAIVVQAIIARKGGWLVCAFFASLLRLYHLAI
jgi:hypothetical protein